MKFYLLPRALILALMLLSAPRVLAGADNASDFLIRSFLTDMAVISVDFSPSGAFIASGGMNRVVEIRNIDTGKVIDRLEGHEDEILAIQYSPNGKIVASGGVDKKIILWSMTTGKKITILEGHNDYVRDLAFSADGKLLCSASSDNTAIIWDVATGSRLQTLSGHPDKVTSIAFNPDGTKVVTACTDRILRVWDIESGSMVESLSGHTDEVQDVKWSNNSKYIVSGGWDNQPRVWEAESGKQVRIFSGHRADISSIAFDQNDLILATGGGDRKIKLWDMSTGGLIVDLHGSSHRADIEEVAFSPDGTRLVSVGRDGLICIWRIPSLEERISLQARWFMENWLKKKPYETSEEYDRRLNKKVEYYEDIKAQLIEQMVAYYSDNIDWGREVELGEYNADYEYFLLRTRNFGALRLKVPRNQAESFMDNYSKVIFKNLKMTFHNGNLKVQSLTAFIKGLNKRYQIST